MIRRAVALAALLAMAGPASADVRQIDAGPIWNDWDAESKCPGVCSDNDREWTGEWRTVPGTMTSTCDCKGAMKRRSGALVPSPAAPALCLAAASAASCAPASR